MTIFELVRTAADLLFLFAVIETLPQAIKEGRNIKISKVDFSAEIDSAEIDNFFSTPLTIGWQNADQCLLRITIFEY